MWSLKPSELPVVIVHNATTSQFYRMTSSPTIINPPESDMITSEVLLDENTLTHFIEEVLAGKVGIRYLKIGASNLQLNYQPVYFMPLWLSAKNLTPKHLPIIRDLNLARFCLTKYHIPLIRNFLSLSNLFFCCLEM